MFVVRDRGLRTLDGCPVFELDSDLMDVNYGYVSLLSTLTASIGFIP